MSAESKKPPNKPRRWKASPDETDMEIPTQLQLVIVTPEKTVLDTTIVSLRFPLFDGQIGVLPGRAPLVGRLGYGELKLSGAVGERSYFIDGGFVQVKGAVVSVLTSRAIPVEDIDRSEAETLLKDAGDRVPTSEAEFLAKQRDQERGRRMLALSHP